MLIIAIFIVRQSVFAVFFPPLPLSRGRGGACATVGRVDGDAHARAKHPGVVSGGYGFPLLVNCEATADACVRAVSAAQGEVRPQISLRQLRQLPRAVRTRRHASARQRRLRRARGTFYLLAQKLVFCNSELDKSTTVWARELLKQWPIYLGLSLWH